VLQGIPALISPEISAKYGQIFDRDDARISAIRSKYSEEFKRIDAVFGSDAGAIAFLMDPSVVLTAKGVQAGASPVLDLVGAFTDDTTVRRRITTLRSVLGMSEGLMLEEDADELVQFIREISPALDGSAKIAEMRQAVESTVNNSFNDVMDVAEQVSDARTLEQLESIIGKRINVRSVEELEGDDEEAAKLLILQTAKSSTLTTLAQALRMNAKELESLDIEDSELSKAAETAASRVEGMIDNG